MATGSLIGTSLSLSLSGVDKKIKNKKMEKVPFIYGERLFGTEAIKAHHRYLSRQKGLVRHSAEGAKEERRLRGEKEGGNWQKHKVKLFIFCHSFPGGSLLLLCKCLSLSLRHSPATLPEALLISTKEVRGEESSHLPEKVSDGKNSLENFGGNLSLEK